MIPAPFFLVITTSASSIDARRKPSGKNSRGDAILEATAAEKGSIIKQFF